MKIKRIVSLLLAVLMTVSCMSLSTLSIGAADTAKNATIKVESEAAATGSTVTLDISIQDNPGILGMTLVVNYDETALKLVAVENGDSLPGMTFTTPKKLSTGCKLPWDAEEVHPEDIQDGVIAHLTFEILPTATTGSSYVVELTHDPGAIIDNDMAPLTVNIENGTITVYDYTPGDLNEDGIIDTKDVVMLRRYIAGGYGVKIKEVAADVNADGMLDTTDIVYIRRFVAGGYGIVLKPGKHIHTEATDAAKAPTCTENGLTEGKHCTTCGEVLVKQETVPSLGHTYGTDNVCDICGHAQASAKLIYAEHFDRQNSSDTEAVLNAIGWDALTTEEDGAPNQTNAAFELRDGKLYYTNYADGIVGKDGYYEIASLRGEFMKDIFRNTYTLQYDIYYTDASDVNRYVNFITEYTPGGKYYNTAHFRIGGYGNNQCRYEGEWLNYEAEDMYDLSAELKDDANENGYTSICKKLLGVDYDGKTYFFKDTVITVRVVYDADKGPELYLKTKDMTEFVQVSRYSEISEVAEKGVWKTWEGTSVLFKIGAKINGWVDNVYLWEGDGDVPTEHTHTWSDWRVTTQAGCLNKGVEQRSCSCGLVDSRLSNETGHDFASGKTCRVCSAAKYSEGLAYTLKADETYSVAVGSCTDTEVIIPAMLPNGRIVNEIASGAFLNCENITDISVPDTIEKVGPNAFAKCTNLTYYTDDYGYYLGNEKNPFLILVDVKDTNLTSFDFRPTTKIIGEKAFFMCKNLTEMNIPEGITQIVRYAFQTCGSLKSVSIPASVKDIAFWSFYQSANIESLTVSAQNPIYQSINNCIIEKATKTLITGVESSVIPTGGEYVTVLGNNAFCALTWSFANVPDGITEIAQLAFQNNKQLQAVCIADSVNVIGKNVFKGCEKFNMVYYTGTAADWAKIRIDASNAELNAATIAYYSEIQPAAGGQYWHYVNGIPTLWKQDTPPAVQEGVVIYEEDFAYANNSNTVSVLKEIGWTRLTKAENGTYNETDAEFAIVDGRLYYDNYDAEGLPQGDTRVRGKDGYYQIDALTENAMQSVAAGKYTLQYDLEYADGNAAPRYATIVTEYAADGQTYNSFHFRMAGYGHHQAHYNGMWKTYSSTDPMVDLNPASTANSDQGAAATGNSIARKLLGVHYNSDVPRLFAGVTVTIKLQYEPGLGHHVYMKTADMSDFVKISEPNPDSDGVDVLSDMKGSAVVFKLGAAIDGYIDNIKLTTGWEQSSCDGHYVNGEWNVETASTCKTNGTSYTICSTCNAKVYRTLPLSDTHNFVNDVCVDCGQCYTPLNYSIGLDYELSADESYYTVTGIGTCTDNTLVIPGKYNGIAVTTIGEDAFINATQITSVIILEGVKIIGADAFRYCNSLKTITLPDSLVEIKSRAFDSCVSLECLEIPVGVTNISNSFGIIAGCISLTTLTVNPLNTTFHSENNCVIKTQTKELWMGCSTSVIPSDGSVETLGRYAFSGMNLQNVVIPDTITTILGYAFQNCDLITSMTIPANVSSIKSTIFNRCDNLTSLTVDPENETYYSVDNCIIEKGTQKLMCVASEFVLPEDGTITTMMGWTFDNQQFTELVIPEGMTMIGQRAFQNCDKLVEITIPDTVISIESGAFTFCDSLSLVRFTGSEEQWNKIVIAEYNDCLLDATIVFGK